VGIRSRSARTHLVIAIDGGVATGKSSVCTAVAQQLRIPYFNAGLLYRGLALWCIDEGISVGGTGDAAAAAARSYPVHVSLDGGGTAIYLSGQDVSARLKTNEVTVVVPTVARHPGVREAINARQRAIVRQAVSTHGGVVIDGRDATTVVVPDANVKILLLTDREVRARRVGTGEGEERAAERDAADAKISDFLRPRTDVAVFDTSDVGLDELVSQVLDQVLKQYPDWRDAQSPPGVYRRRPAEPHAQRIDRRDDRRFGPDPT